MSCCDCGNRITHPGDASRCLDCLQRRALARLGVEDPADLPEEPPRPLAQLLSA